jgi:hypothetical protein
MQLYVAAQLAGGQLPRQVLLETTLSCQLRYLRNLIRVSFPQSICASKAAERCGREARSDSPNDRFPAGARIT